MAKVSVIIPAHNVAKYLPRALDSLTSQTHQEWEAVVIDDGSTDESAAIARQYCSLDRRFRLLQQENKGQAAARNIALESASGTFVMYLDADDMLHPQAMEICLKAAARDKSDMVTFTYDHVFRTLNKWSHRLGMGDVKPKIRRFDHYDYYVTDNIFRHATEGNRPKGVDKKWRVKHCQAWRCMISMELARKAHFAEGVKYEDMPWWGEILLNVKRTTITRLPLYFYYPSPESFIMSAPKSEHIRSLEAVIAQTDELYSTATPEQKAAWTANFRQPFLHMLQHKKLGILHR